MGMTNFGFVTHSSNELTGEMQLPEEVNYAFDELRVLLK